VFEARDLGVRAFWPVGSATVVSQDQPCVPRVHLTNERLHGAQTAGEMKAIDQLLGRQL